MSERVMPKMFDYQKEIVEDTTSKIIIGNYARSLGKNYVLACKLLYERPKNVSLIDSNFKSLKIMEDKFKEIFHGFPEVRDSIEYFNCMYDRLKIKFNNGDEVNMYAEKTRGIDIDVWDMVFYNDCLPLGNVNTKRSISMVTMPCKFLKWKYPYDSVKVCNAGLKQLLDNGFADKESIYKSKNNLGYRFRDEIDILNEYDELFTEDDWLDWLEIADTENLNIFVDASIMKLIREFSNIPQTDRTTLTRNNLLDMIEKLQRIKNK